MSEGRKRRVAVYGVCIDSDDRVLLVRASRQLTVAGRWFLPGGGLEFGEEPLETLRREFREETGLTVGNESLRGVLSDLTTLPDETLLHTIRIIYTVQTWTGVERAEDDGSSDGILWVKRSDLGSLPDPVLPYVTRAVFDLA
jgi:8-oxo-dGTP diphosphatase